MENKEEEEEKEVRYNLEEEKKQKMATGKGNTYQAIDGNIVLHLELEIRGILLGLEELLLEEVFIVKVKIVTNKMRKRETVKWNDVETKRRNE